MIEKMAKAKKKHNWMAGFTLASPILNEADRYINTARMYRIHNIRSGKNPKVFKNY
jgi:hypothetical protein